VADTGEGVAPEERERAFEPFRRAIVEANGGRIWFADFPLGGRECASACRWRRARLSYRADTAQRLSFRIKSARN
jgi:signal transduction histidine kinase